MGALPDPSESGPSSSRLSISSGLLPIVAREEDVLRRCECGPAAGRGGALTSFAAEAFRVSHENGLVSFLGKAVGSGTLCLGGAGGGAHGADGKAAERPCERDGSLGGGPGASTSSGFDLSVDDRDRDESLS